MDSLVDVWAAEPMRCLFFCLVAIWGQYYYSALMLTSVLIGLRITSVCVSLFCLFVLLDVNTTNVVKR